MKYVSIVIVAVGALLGATGIIAQVPVPVLTDGLTAQVPAASDVPVLTDVQKLTVTNKIKDAQIAATAASPEALAKAIADLIAARQQAAIQSDRAANEYYQSLQKPGFTLDPQTWTYVKTEPKPKPVGGGE